MRQRQPSVPLSRDRVTEEHTSDFIDRSIQHRIRECPYAFMFSKVEWQFDSGILTLQGAVQSFYLKQILQELLRNVDEVQKIVNDVDVVSPTGLSSVRPGPPASSVRERTSHRDPSLRNNRGDRDGRVRQNGSADGVSPGDLRVLGPIPLDHARKDVQRPVT